MECPHCNNTEIIKFFQEILDCPHCNESICIEYFMCHNCGITFKYTGEDIFSEVQFSHDEFKNLFGASKEEMFNHYSNIDTMSDNIHSCIKCGGLAFEIEDGLYKCTKCGFEVEVE